MVQLCKHINHETVKGGVCKLRCSLHCNIQEISREGNQEAAGETINSRALGPYGVDDPALEALLRDKTDAKLWTGLV